MAAASKNPTTRQGLMLVIIIIIIVTRLGISNVMVGVRMIVRVVTLILAPFKPHLVLKPALQLAVRKLPSLL